VVAARDGCAARRTASREPERVTHVRWHGCAAGSRVEHLRVGGDTHGWPSLADANGPMVRFLRFAAGRTVDPRALNRQRPLPTMGP
jgi:poly(3-hydroxybutyrate) depolymerase